MLTLVDSSVLLDILDEDPLWESWSERALERCAADSDLCINPIIYAEVSVTFPRIEDVDEAFPESLFERLQLPLPAAFLAGKAFLQYRRQGGTRTRALPDFFIGAHAAVMHMRLLTRSPRHYRTYFPTVELIAPDNADQ